MSRLKKVPDELHWGHWVLRRSRYVGFPTQADLAVRVGVTTDMLCRWVARPQPPTFRIGNGHSLAEALRTDPAILISLWKSVPPESVHAVGPSSGLSKKLTAIGELLTGEKLNELVRHGELLLYEQTAVATAASSVPQPNAA